MFKKEMTILINKYADTFWCRFFDVVNGKLVKASIEQKWYQSTIDIYENILTNFFIGIKKEKFLTYIGYTTLKPNDEEYLGIKIQNSEEEKLNIYFTSKILSEFVKLDRLMQIMKMSDFYHYATRYIEKEPIEKIAIRPSADDRSSITYISDNKEYNSLRIKRQLGYYYRKNNSNIDEVDVWNICNIIRHFINSNIKSHPRYEYNETLKIICNPNVFLEIEDSDLIDQLEKKRILDDLWLVMHGVIKKMPLQEESLNKKEELKRKRRKYLKEKNLP